METRSGRRLSTPPPRQGSRRRRDPRDADLIGALPDDILLLVLVRLRCVCTAARTGLLSRRWLGLWTRLPDLAFDRIAPATVESALSRFSASPPVSLLDIRIRVGHAAVQANSLLRAAALVSPAELSFYFPGSRVDASNLTPIELPCFHRITSIKLETLLCVKPPMAGEFTALERLTIRSNIDNLGTFTPPSNGVFPALEKVILNGNIVDLGTFLSRCLRLRTITRLLPQELVFTHLLQAQGPQHSNIDLPCFHHATSIKLNMHNICFTRLLDGEFSKLRRLSLKGCIIDDLGTLVSRCPHLRVLKVKAATSKRDITVHSASMQELALGTCTECRGINIITPMLKELKMEVHADKDINVSISAPMLEKVSWQRKYTGLPTVFGFWHLQNLSLERRGLLTDNHVLFVDMCASDSSNAELSFAQEIEKVLVTDFSVLNIRLKAVGHVYGATLLNLFSVLHVHTGLKILKVILLRSKKSEVLQACSGNCSCDSPTTWRSQSISMTQLEEVEIKGLKGDDHEFDLLKLMLRCALPLKRMTVELGNGIRSYDYGGCTKKINDISLDYPSVDFHVYVSGRLVLHSCSSCS
ncbi:uncharacterized protein LOC124677637 [Lolium rigidum]|uniref:uncharacterized protein LOC124677637 n=1 Tax=Lolium rigidum TaxID=89674 RepID=UPI001F5CBA2B|nr:uncharacterized protein LOC124677637 [Lolium rigidum]